MDADDVVDDVIESCMCIIYDFRRYVLPSIPERWEIQFDPAYNRPQTVSL